MQLRAFLLGLAAVAVCSGCAAGGDRSSTPASGASGAGGTQLGSRCLTGTSVSCALQAPAPLDGACSCDTSYGPQSGKVVP